MKVNELSTFIAGAVTFASKDSMLPVLNAVRFETGEDGTQYLYATDRYRLARYRFTDTDTPGVTATMSVADAKILVAVLKGRHAREVVSLTTDEDGSRLTLTDMTGAVIWQAGTVVGDYPAVTRIMDTWEPRGKDEDHRYGYNPDYLGSFSGKAIRGTMTLTEYRGTALIVEPGAGRKGTRITFGDRFEGLLMPVRVPED